MTMMYFGMSEIIEEIRPLRRKFLWWPKRMHDGKLKWLGFVYSKTVLKHSDYTHHEVEYYYSDILQALKDA